MFSGGDKSAAPGRFGTISSFKRDEEESSEDSDDEGQAFYAGGSESRYDGTFLCMNKLFDAKF